MKNFLKKFIPLSFRQGVRRRMINAKKIFKNSYLIGSNWPSRILNLLRICLAKNFIVRGRLDYPRQKIIMSVSSFMQLKRLSACQKEPETVAWIEEFMKPEGGEIFYDIGANVGAYSFVAWAWTGGRSMVYAFEPGAPSFGALAENISKNKGASEAIFPMPIALSEHTGIFNFQYRDLKPGRASHFLAEPGAKHKKGFIFAFSQSVLSFCLDDFIETLKIPSPNHIKIDVDGAELSVIRGAVKTLTNTNLRSLLIEIDESMERSSEIFTRLKDAGFRIYKKHRRGLEGKKTYNCVFIRGNSDAGK